MEVRKGVTVNSVFEVISHVLNTEVMSEWVVSECREIKKQPVQVNEGSSLDISKYTWLSQS